ncbi:MAG TPA: hypothetical protein VGE07_23625 [Herpetosiphonaceae bacterium]
MSIFSPAAAKITDLLGITTKGAATAANSMPVTLATDGVVGTTADAVVTTDTTGTLSAKLRGLVKHAYERMPAALGRASASACLPVVLSTEDLAALNAPSTPKPAVQVVNISGLSTISNTDVSSQDLRAYSAIRFGLNVTGTPDGSTLRVAIQFVDPFGTRVTRIRFTDVTVINATARQFAILIPRQAPTVAVGAQTGSALTDLAQTTIEQGPISNDFRVTCSVSSPGGSTSWGVSVYVEGIY